MVDPPLSISTVETGAGAMPIAPPQHRTSQASGRVRHPTTSYSLNAACYSFLQQSDVIWHIKTSANVRGGAETVLKHSSLWVTIEPDQHDNPRFHFSLIDRKNRLVRSDARWIRKNLHAEGLKNGFQYLFYQHLVSSMRTDQ